MEKSLSMVLPELKTRPKTMNSQTSRDSFKNFSIIPRKTSYETGFFPIKSSQVQSVVLIKSFREISETYSIYKNLIEKSSADMISNIFEDTFNLIGIYGDFRQCKIESEKYFGIETLEIPQIDEGLVLFYSIENKRSLLWHKFDYENILNKRPISIDNPLVYIVRLLSDLCPLVIGYIPEKEVDSWSAISPYGNSSIQHIIKEAQIIKEKLRELENLNDLALEKNDMNVYLTQESCKNIIFATCSKITVNSEDPVLREIIDNFISEILGEGFSHINFNLSFNRLISELKVRISSFSCDFGLVQEQLQIIFKKYRDEVKNIMIGYLSDIRDKLERNIELNSAKQPYVKKNSIKDLLEELRNKLSRLKNMRSADAAINKFLMSNGLKHEQTKKFISISYVKRA
ncbi:hypothetical protein SteCoe_27342 [Stentor coeruleus]|uniref:Uncharacterized protein n=1 Tax=Stentor coeruleus TaxID=5963 RepID=A0A1R2BAN8_9CILI|nr:hypothetical protein SteCoe_27342 [Stentor coeruleus]